MNFFSTTPAKLLAEKRERALKQRIVHELNEKSQEVEYEHDKESELQGGT